MEGHENSIKQNLQDRLLDAVKQCQTHFGARQEVASESDLRVNTLCLEWEAVLSHGFKKPKTTKLLGFGKVDNLTGIAFWPAIRPLLSSEEKERFACLRFITTDIGRGRAWLRGSINERTLENYMQTLLSDRNHLRNHYEPHAFVMDEERGTMLPVMAAGLSSIIFSIAFDVDYLNSPLKTFEVPRIDSALQPASSSVVAASIKPSFALRMGSAPQDDDVVAISNKKGKKKKKKTPSPDSNLLDQTTPTNPINQATPINPFDETPTATNPFDIDTPTNPFPESVLPSDVCNLGPVSGSTHQYGDRPLVGVAYPFPSLSPEGEEEEGEDDRGGGGGGTGSCSPVDSVHSYSDEMGYTTLFNPSSFSSSSALNALEGALLATQSLPSSHNPSPIPTVMPTEISGGGGGGGWMSESEMKEALRALARSKESIEESQKATLEELNVERERVKNLEKELEEVQQKLNSTDEAHTQQQQSLERENDLLREQLKRYVGMVKQQQGGEGKGDGDEETESEQTSKKLVEMAEMYGELMEFNEHLHKSTQTKNNIIIKLVRTLKLANIPLPVSPDLLPREALEPAKTVEVWIPSVIKRGRGPDAHHAYQVYVKLGSEEWNVYRRYAQMYEFHKQLLKNLQGMEDFTFPPKKAIRNKGSQVIEERRKRLQQYLRSVLDLCSQPVIKRRDGRVNTAFITEGMSKEQFLKILPFFDDSTVASSQPKVPVQRSPSYSGL
ncbi:PREDICTED: sorting nexin-29-like [Amphimedon queenslandica]|uniref:PX domain-containing protein n=1 Tax=Amphimedon queenslandica TaxID=400682 RepID=A0A1X7VGB1_AMPQE|nr:PREDICTED: sorting nexin-29-like [Amphimedon queenslandica]|eukprot:XP_019849243.1 PREDICTED: sorting nexin-29-like [Amphimedon queenslandica]